MKYENKIKISIPWPADFSTELFTAWCLKNGITDDEWDFGGYLPHVMSFVHEEHKLLAKLRFGL